MKRALIRVLAGVALLCGATSARAILTIEITQALEGGMPIAIVPFRTEGAPPPQDVAAIIEADLVRSGRFSAVPPQDFVSTPSRHSDVVFKDWRISRAEALVIGQVHTISPARHMVEFRLYDIFKEQQLAGYVYVVDSAKLRSVAHQIADLIYERLTGEPGAFNTRIAYVTRERGPKGLVFRLQVADSDGYNPVTILTSPEPLLSPAWSHDGTRLAYVSFEQRRSMIFVQNVETGERYKLTEQPGLVSAPAWSPDDSRLALVLSRDGNPEIYVMNLADKSLERLTRHGAIDTEPAWSPDGRELVFTSDRSGKPQIYRMDADGGKVERVTFEGDYNARASYSPDGKTLALVSRTGTRFRTALLHRKGVQLQVLTDGALDESPSFAPNGRMILYATSVQGRGVLASVSADGRVRQLLKATEGDVREPAWSPFNPQLQHKE